MNRYVLSFLLITAFLVPSGAQFLCEDGFVVIDLDTFPCSNIDVLAMIPNDSMGGTGSTGGNDIWGWADPGSGREFVLMGLHNGTSFVEITDPIHPVYLGRLPTQTSNSSWRDIKVIKNYAYIVSEASAHGVQIFDLNELLDVENPPVLFEPTNMINDIGSGSAHNIVIDEYNEMIFVVGARGNGGCSGGLIYFDVSDPMNPGPKKCFSADGYTHDAQCIVYQGPDSAHIGKQICFNSNEDTKTIVDVTDRDNPVQLSRTGYPNRAYTHQGWVTDDHRYLLFNDELDERNIISTIHTHIFDIQDLDQPIYLGYHKHNLTAIDHNMYIKGQYVYQSNYEAGLRILDHSLLPSDSLIEVAFLDTYPSQTTKNFRGTWSNYPYFPSGHIAVSNLDGLLFIVKPNLPHFTLSTIKETKVVCSGGQITIPLQYTTWYGFTEQVSLSTLYLPDNISAQFSQNQVTETSEIALTLDLPDDLHGKYHFTIAGYNDDSTSMHKIAGSIQIIEDNDITMITDTIKMDSTIISSNFVTIQDFIQQSNSSFQLFTPAAGFHPNSLIAPGSSFTLKLLEGCQSNTSRQQIQIPELFDIRKRENLRELDQNSDNQRQ